MSEVSILIGPHGVGDIPANFRTPAELYDEAVFFVSQFAVVFAEFLKLGVRSSSYSEHLSSMTFDLISDTISSARLIRSTSHHYRTSNDDGILLLLGSPNPWRQKTIDVSREDQLDEYCTAIEIQLLDEQLERVWRAPQDFPRTGEFHAELFSRSAKLSLSLGIGQDISEDEARIQFARIEQTFEQSKKNPSMAVEVWRDYCDRNFLSRSFMNETNLKRSLKKGLWPEEIERAFEWNAAQTLLRCRHLALWARRTESVGFEMPQIDGTQPPK